MVSGDNVTVTLTGGSPWGFRLTGGGSMPLQIAKIRKKSQAHAQGLQEGDAVVSINGIPVHDRSHDQAVDLIDSAGDTLTLQIYRGDADDLGQLLASSKHHAPLLPPQAEGQGDVVVSSSTSTTSVTEAEGRRREVQQNVFVTKDGNTESTTFVRREHTITTSSDVGDVNGNDVGVGGRDRNLTAQIEVSTSLESAPIVSLSPKPAASPKPSSPKPSLSPHKPVSPKPVSPVPFDPSPQVHFPGSVSGQPQPQSQIQVQIQPRPAADGPVWVPKGPTFKAVPPKVAPDVAPKPVLKQQQFTVKPIFNAKAVATAATPTFAPQKFQVSATAMYSQQPQSPGGQQVKFQPQQQYSPAMKQHLSQQNGQPYSPGSQQLFSPMSNSSPLSPVSQPFSPISPSGSSMPMFNVRNNAGEGARTWLPNMWLPDQEPNEEPQNQQQQQQQQQPQQRYQHPPPQQNHHNENIEIPNRMSIKERQQMLLNHAAATKHSLSARQADPDFDAPPEEVQRMASHKMKIFGPPVEMTTQGPLEHWDGMHLVRTDSVESDGSSPTSSLHRKKKLYADSAFYEDPTHKYPTIDEQMKLCRLISNSLTSAANKRARGAKMFAKRKRKSQKWVHEGHSEWSSSAGDVANIEDLESELGVEEGGNKQLFMFRIPKLKQRISSPERNTKMSMKKDEFERLRLQGQKCDHRTVSPGTCFDIAADLKAHRGRGGRLFERRKNRADKFIIDESNAKMVGPKTTKLDNILGTAPLKSSQSPWEAAQSNQAGRVDSAFDHLNDIERMQKMKQMMKVYTPPKPAQPTREVLQPLNPPPPTKGPKTDLRGSGVSLLQGRNFNRYAKGWCASGGDMQDRAGSTAAHQAGPQQQQHAQNHHPHQTHMGAQDYPMESAPRGQPRVHFGDYNPRPRAWQSAAQPGDSYSCPASMSASWASSDFDSYHHSPSGAAGGGGGLYSPNELPASDL